MTVTAQQPRPQQRRGGGPRGSKRAGSATWRRAIAKSRPAGMTSSRNRVTACGLAPVWPSGPAGPLPPPAPPAGAAGAGAAGTAGAGTPAPLPRPEPAAAAAAPARPEKSFAETTPPPLTMPATPVQPAEAERLVVAATAWLVVVETAAGLAGVTPSLRKVVPVRPV